MPASNESSIEYSWRALRFWATVFSSPISALQIVLRSMDTRLADEGPTGTHATCPGRTNAGPEGPAFELRSAHHPPGGRSARDQLRARWCSASVDPTLHITSFRSPASYGKRAKGATTWTGRSAGG